MRRSGDFESEAFDTVEEILVEFAGPDRADLAAACIGIAGLVRDGRAAATNRGWRVEQRSLARSLGLEDVGLINDLHAAALGLDALEPADLLVLNEGKPDAQGNVAVLAAGTGLGRSGLVRARGQVAPLVTESGHAAFAPSTDEQIELLRYLRSTLSEPVSVELVCSGPGIVNIFRWCLRESSRSAPAWFEQAAGGGQPAAVASAAADGADEDAVRAIRVFVEIFGAEAGNAALQMLATGGVYIAGGLSVKLAPALRQGAFLSAFQRKSRMGELLSQIPVRLVLTDRLALLGAAREAARSLTRDRSGPKTR